MIGLGDIVEDCMTDFVIYSSALWAILPAWQINCVVNILHSFPYTIDDANRISVRALLIKILLSGLCSPGQETSISVPTPNNCVAYFCVVILFLFMFICTITYTWFALQLYVKKFKSIYRCHTDNLLSIVSLLKQTPLPGLSLQKRQLCMAFTSKTAVTLTQV